MPMHPPHPRSPPIRCRRQHQNTCAGVIRKGLCAKHRTEWEAMQADWDRRAKEAEAKADAASRPKSQPWRRWEDNIIRTHPARQAAEKLPHRSEHAVWCRRSTLGITNPPWTQEEDDIIRTNPLKTATKLLPGRTYSAVSQRRLRIGAVAKRVGYNAWTPDDDKVLQEHPTADAARILGRTAKAVKARRHAARIPAPAPGTRAWTALEDEIVKHKSIRGAESTLNRARAEIIARRKHFGITRVQEGAWSEAENTILLEQSGSAKHLQQWLPHRTVSAITNQRAKLRETRLPGSGNGAEQGKVDTNESGLGGAGNTVTRGLTTDKEWL